MARGEVLLGEVLVDQALHPAGELRIHRDNRLRGRTGFAQVGVVVGVEHRLVIHRRMYGGDRAVFDTDGVVQCLDYRHNPVGGAGRIGNDSVVGREGVMIDAEYHRCIHVGLRGLREQDTTSAPVQVSLHRGPIAEGAGALKHQVYPELPPGQVIQPLLPQQRNALAIHGQ